MTNKIRSKLGCLIRSIGIMPQLITACIIQVGVAIMFSGVAHGLSATMPAHILVDFLKPSVLKSPKHTLSMLLIIQRTPTRQERLASKSGFSYLVQTCPSLIECTGLPAARTAKL